MDSPSTLCDTILHVQSGQYSSQHGYNRVDTLLHSISGNQFARQLAQLLFYLGEQAHIIATISSSIVSVQLSFSVRHLPNTRNMYSRLMMISVEISLGPQLVIREHPFTNIRLPAIR